MTHKETMMRKETSATKSPRRLWENGKGCGVQLLAERFPKGASCAAPPSQRRGTKKIALRSLRLCAEFLKRDP